MREMTKKERLATVSGTHSLVDEVGSVIEVVAYSARPEHNMEGEEAIALYLMDSNGEVYSTLSPIFIDSFNTLVDMVYDLGEEYSGDKSFPIKVLMMQPKKGKGEYLTLKPVLD